MSDDEAWRPVVSTGREDALVESFPSYLREATFPWLGERAGLTSHGNVKPNLFVKFQNASRTFIGFKGDDSAYLGWNNTVLPHLRKLDDETYTNLLDFAASEGHFPAGSTHPLERILSDGGSAWTLTRWQKTHARLTKRVSDGVRSSMTEVLNATDVASRKLQEAWLDAYGTNPRASVAYSHAVVAVETAALSVIPTVAPEPTLANLFSVLEADTATWRLVFRDNQKAPGGKALAAMLRTLWRGHESRHGRPDYSDATLEEARAAVVLAGTLVQWFTSGVVRPVSASR